jgi:hypothetical protein
LVFKEVLCQSTELSKKQYRTNKPNKPTNERSECIVYRV